MTTTIFKGDITPQIAQILQDAYEAIKKIDPQFKMENDGYRLCKEDTKYLKDVAFKAKNSELECVEEDEFKSHKRELLIGLGAGESKIF